MISPVLAFFSPGLPEMIIIGIIALLLFGKRLPEVARSLGKGLVEFKKGVRGIEEEVDSATYSTEESSSASRPVPDEEADSDESTAPKFEPPPAEPRDTSIVEAEESAAADTKTPDAEKSES